MRKTVLAVVILLLTAVSVFAENRNSEYYYVNVALEKVFPYRKGYVVQYRKGVYERAQLYLPLEWFTSAGNKGEVINLPSGNTWPSLTIYYKEGNFSHCKLYLRSHPHESWGNIPLGTNLDDHFEGIEELKLEY